MPERIEWDDDAAHHIRTRSQRYLDGVDIEPEWTNEAINDPDRIVDEPDPLPATPTASASLATPTAQRC